MHRFRQTLLLAAALLLISVPSFAFQVEVTVENVGPEGGAFLTPAWIGFHMGQFDSYDGGASADGFPGLEQIAEDGNSGPLSDDFALQVPMGVQATVPGPNGPIFPGDSATMRFDIEPSYHRYISYVSMVIPSNDAFIANGNPLAHRVFDPNGVFTPVEFYVLGSEVNDAGTEVNDEIPANVAALAQAAPNTGVTENGVVTDHPGFIPGGNILAAIANGQFVRPGYRVAKVTVKAVRTTDVYFGADAAQQSAAVDSPATAACKASLNNAGNRLTVGCEHDITNTVAAAHVHIGEAGTDGGVLFPFADASTNPIQETFEVTPEQVANLLDGQYYVNIHTDAFPAGEIRGQIDGCFEGVDSLCLNEERFQVNVSFESNDAGSGAGKAIEGTADSGFFYFFANDNIELDIKVLDGCAINDNYWVFIAGLTNVGVTITVEDTLTGDVRTYSNPLDNDFELVSDTEAFATCP